MLLSRGEVEEARAILEPVHGSYQADAILARLDLEPALPELTSAFAALDEGLIEGALDVPDRRDRRSP